MSCVANSCKNLRECSNRCLISVTLFSLKVRKSERVSPNIALGWIYGEDFSRKTSLIGPQGILEIWQNERV